MAQRPDPDSPQDVLLEWRPEAEGASILDIGWEAEGGDIQFGFSNGYFDIYAPKSGSPDDRLDDILEYAQAVSIGRLVAYSETDRKMRTETTVFGCRSGPQLHRTTQRTNGAPDTFVIYAPW